MNDFVLNIILSEIEHQGWCDIYPPKFKECAVEIYQAIEKAGYCITPKCECGEKNQPCCFVAKNGDLLRSMKKGAR